MSEFIQRLDEEFENVKRNVNRKVRLFQEQNESGNGVSVVELCETIKCYRRWLWYIDRVYFDHGMSCITYSNYWELFTFAIEVMEGIHKTGNLIEGDLTDLIFFEGIQED